MEQGYPGKFTGAMCDMRRPQPVWNAMFVKYFKQLGWQDVSTSYYRMSSGTILPVHQDTYKRYMELFDLAGREHTIHRAIVFLEDWASGHYLEIDSEPIIKWAIGDVVTWCYDTPHMAANMGLTPRYTLQITGHL
jgi:sugar phosphate isomerase/epimerase